MTERPDWHQWRIPLPGDVDGIVLWTSSRTLTSAQWDYFGTVLGAMRPGLVDGGPAEPIEASDG